MSHLLRLSPRTEAQEFFAGQHAVSLGTVLVSLVFLVNTASTLAMLAAQG